MPWEYAYSIMELKEEQRKQYNPVEEALTLLKSALEKEAVENDHDCTMAMKGFCNGCEAIKGKEVWKCKVPNCDLPTIEPEIDYCKFHY